MTPDNEFIAPSWAQTLHASQLDRFDRWWTHALDWVDEPNTGRGGWSGVGTLTLISQEKKVTLFVKRQVNHVKRTWRYPLGQPTCQIEYTWLKRFHECGLPTLEPVYCATCTDAEGSKAVLATVGLSEFAELSALSPASLPRPAKHVLISAVADVLRRMHAQRIQHGCFFPKHVFYRFSAEAIPEVRLIDLEKCAYRPFAIQCAMRDLDSFNRHAPGWSNTDRLRFLLAYRQTRRFGWYERFLWRYVARRQRMKTSRRETLSA